MENKMRLGQKVANYFLINMNAYDGKTGKEIPKDKIMISCPKLFHMDDLEFDRLFFKISNDEFKKEVLKR